MLLPLLLIIVFINDVGSIPLNQFTPFEGSVNGFLMTTNTIATHHYSGQTPMPFYNRNYYSILFHRNGYATFDCWLFSRGPESFPLNNTCPMIAGMWTEISLISNISCGNQSCNHIYTRPTWTAVDNVTRSMISTHIRTYLPAERSFTPSIVFSGTWIRAIGFLNQTNVSNTFQIVYATDGIRSFTFLLYNALQWSRSSNSQFAEAGFNAGNRLSFQRLPDTGTENITRLANTSNVGVPGLFIYRTDGIANAERCGNILPITFQPRYGGLLGSTAVFLQGPCFTNRTTGAVRCRFGNIGTVNGVVLSDVEVMCLTPSAMLPGAVSISLSTDGGATFNQAQYYFYYFPLTLGIGLFSYAELMPFNRTGPIVANGEQITFGWYFSPWTQSKWPQNQSILLSIQMAVVSLNQINGGLSVGSFTLIRSGIIPVIGYQTTIITIPLITGNMQAVVFRVMAQDNSTATMYGGLYSTIFVYNTGPSSADNYCQTWMSAEPSASTWNQALLGCPISLVQARVARCCYGQDWSCFQTSFNYTGNCAFRRGRPAFAEATAVSCFQSWTFNPSGARSTCCYDVQGSLITRGRGAGTADRYHPSWQPVRHFFGDAMPFLACCYLSSNNSDCDNYINLRPPQRATNVGFTWGGGWGDPHYITLDGSSYTFNGYGEYTYLAVTTTSTTTPSFNPSIQSFSFMSQVRTAPRILSNGTIPNRVTITRGFAAKSDHIQAERVSVIISNREQLIVHRGNDTIDFDGETEDQIQRSDLQRFTYPEMIIERNRTSEVIQLSWYMGISVIIQPFKLVSPELTLVLNIDVSVDESMKNRTSGLLGPYDGATANDMRAANGTIIGLADSLSPDVIYYQFGQSWAIDPSRSLFYYEASDSATFYASQNMNFTPIFGSNPMTPTQEASVRAACNISSSSNQSTWTVAQRTCYYDISITNDTSFGRASSAAASNIAENINNRRNPPLFNPSLPVSLTVNASNIIRVNFTATSEYGSAILYTIQQGPLGAQFNNTTGYFVWQVPSSSINETVVLISAQDNQYNLTSTYEVFIRILDSTSNTTTNPNQLVSSSALNMRFNCCPIFQSLLVISGVIAQMKRIG